MSDSAHRSFLFPISDNLLHSPQLNQDFHHHGDEMTLGKYQEDEEDHQYVFFYNCV